MKIFDTRDGAKDEKLQCTPIRDILGLPWNRGVERSLSGCSIDHKKAMRRLVQEAKKNGESVIAANYHNFAVSILVDPNCAA